VYRHGAEQDLTVGQQLGQRVRDLATASRTDHPTLIAVVYMDSDTVIPAAGV
jgi:hypothetical protein